METRIGKISIENVNNRFVVRMENGVAIVLGCTKKALDQLLHEISQGIWDEYYKKYGNK